MRTKKPMPSKYNWCLHCERTYQKSSKLKKCPYEDCDGSVLMDGWNWDELRTMHPNYPEIPEQNKVYPLY